MGKPARRPGCNPTTPRRNPRAARTYDERPRLHHRTALAGSASAAHLATAASRSIAARWSSLNPLGIRTTRRLRKRWSPLVGALIKAVDGRQQVTASTSARRSGSACLSGAAANPCRPNSQLDGVGRSWRPAARSPVRGGLFSVELRRTCGLSSSPATAASGPRRGTAVTAGAVIDDVGARSATSCARSQKASPRVAALPSPVHLQHLRRAPRRCHARGDAGGWHRCPR